MPASPEPGASAVSAPVGPGAWPPGFVATGADRDALLALSHLETMLPRELHELAWREGTAVACRTAILRGRAGTETDRAIVAAVRPDRVRGDLARCSARALAPGDEEYPQSLLDLPDPPACLFVRGRPPPGAPLGSRLAVTVVGARLCSAYGREVAEAIGAGLAAAGVVVVSGAALGIDGAAHRGALRARGPTVAVLGSGIDQPYPRRHRDLIERVAAAGTVVSEYPPGTRPHPRRFPARNRIVAALGRAVVVVEGASGSGSLITAEFAEDLGRDVLAVPGPVTSPLSEAPHELIRDGGTLVRGPDDVLAWLGVAGVAPDRASGPRGILAEGLPPLERSVLEAVAGAAVTVDAVAALAGVETPAALTALMSLELRGLVRAVGGRYERTRRGP